MCVYAEAFCPSSDSPPVERHPHNKLDVSFVTTVQVETDSIVQPTHCVHDARHIPSQGMVLVLAYMTSS
jgi:hypothetical protein